jgi:hypothetical protein
MEKHEIDAEPIVVKAQPALTAYERKIVAQL